MRTALEGQSDFLVSAPTSAVFCRSSLTRMKLNFLSDLTGGAESSQHSWSAWDLGFWPSNWSCQCRTRLDPRIDRKRHRRARYNARYRALDDRVMVGYYQPISRCATRLWAPKRDCPDSGEKRLAGLFMFGEFCPTLQARPRWCTYSPWLRLSRLLDVLESWITTSA